MFAYATEISFALLETLPIAGITGCLAAALLFFESLRLLMRDSDPTRPTRLHVWN
jgi:hypothetical protein